MAQIETEQLQLKEIYQLSFDIFSKYGCDNNNATALARTVETAERDGSLSHGLFRIPGYIASLKSGKVKGSAQPKLENNMASIVSVDADHGYAPFALERGLPVLAQAANQTGIAIMKITNTFHFAALWPETEFLAEKGLVGVACTVYKPAIAPISLDHNPLHTAIALHMTTPALVSTPTTLPFFVNTALTPQFSKI